MSGLGATHWTLVEAAQRGDAAALRALCATYRPAVLAWLERRGVGPDAEDLAQEALVRLLEAALARADRERGRFRGLVFAVARHALLRHREREAAQKRGGGRVEVRGDLDPPAAPEEPDDDFDREWLAVLVEGALARLAREHPPWFEALRRFAVLGQPQAEVAAALATTTGAVKKQVLRARRRLGEYLREAVWQYSRSRGDYEVELRALARLLGPLDAPA